MITDRWEDLIPLRQKNSQEYVPSIEQIIDYAQFIGLEFPGDQHLLYLAKQGITASLPQEWQACQTFSGDMVYRNLITKQVQTEHPLDLIYREKVSSIKNQPLSDYFNQQFDLTKKTQFLPPIQQDKAQFSQSSLSDYFQPIGKLNQFKNNSQESLPNYAKELFSQPVSNSFQTKNEQKSRPKASLKNQSKTDKELSQNISSVKTNQSKKIFKLNIKEKAELSSNIARKVEHKKSPQSVQIYSSRNQEASKSLHNSKTVYNNRNPEFLEQLQMSDKADNQFIVFSDGKTREKLEKARQIQRLESQLQRLTMEQQLKQNILKQLKQSNETKLALIKTKMQVKMQNRKKKDKRREKQHIQPMM